MKLIRINMAEKKVITENVPDSYAVLGGRALTSEVIDKEVDPTCHPLGQNNKLVIAPGLLSGTSAPSSGRLSIGFKSPLTGGIKESNSGGTAAQKLARLGIKAIIIEQIPKDKSLFMLKITKDGVELLDGSALRGKANYEICATLQKQYGERACVMSIGPAGEYKLSGATVAVSDNDGRPVRHCGRGGGGAVLGSKGIKAIVIDDTDAPKVAIHDQEKFKEAARDFGKILTSHPVSGQGLPLYGTAVLVNILNEAGGLPTKNFRYGRFDFADKISGEMVHDVIKERQGKVTHACHPGCVIRCSQVYHDKEGKYLTAGFEYETIWAFGANCMIDDIDAIAKLDYLCDDIGIDTIEMGVTMGVAMEGGVIPFGDADGAIKLLEQVRQGTELGRIIGNGAGFTGKAFGVTRVPTVKNQGIPAYDPRSVKGIGVTYATSTMGADHTAGYSVTANILKVGSNIDPLKKEGQVELSRNLQIATAAVDSTGLCLFTAFALLDEPRALQRVVDMLNAQYNLQLTIDDVTALGKAVLKTERSFNIKAGLNEAEDRLPEFFQEELDPHGTVFDVSDAELDQFYNF
ncbi:MAG: aldehyde:ferredoxin oxidoreductase [Peptococcaceae bacterium BICA1-8]|nr:MAG: aldehyde:ferredoxin oxidoreductase [Peptococcaceae bacterium BICA1-8]